ncbi:hypothetical protein FQN57_005400 [Myotisia sp. PD_48]|nr:hypothetical protein FQN57_005400 [Myotisia sp. PD_48]
MPSKSQTTDKGQYYIDSLDAARCNQNWNSIPGLLKKITKHAPDRKCLRLTAQAECRIVEFLSKGAPGNSTDQGKIRDIVPILQSAMTEAQTTRQDRFQAQICIGWIHWELSEPEEAVSQLPEDFNVVLDWLSGNGIPMSAWTEVCIIKGAAQSLAFQKDEALQTLKSIFSWAATPISNEISNPQLSFWSEQLLAKSAILAHESFMVEWPYRNEKLLEFALRSIRLWASHPGVKSGDLASSTEYSGLTSPSSRALLWKSYYDLLSTILQDGLLYLLASDSSKRGQFATEFRRVEAVCESVLLQNTKFPKANCVNSDIERWVEQVIRNWEIFCGPDWCDEDFGEGGRDAISRNVLDVLYRAATKTFHSTLILRRLFYVHTALAEFELALQALDTYLHLVTSAKARASQHGTKVEDIESDSIFISTLSEGIVVLCCFGPQKDVEKVEHLTSMLERALSEVTEHKEEHPNSPSDGKYAEPGWHAFAYRALGIGRATWARGTPKTKSRTDVQASAVSALEESLSIDNSDGPNPATAFALALLLAETRDVSSAIDLVRETLTSSKEKGARAQQQTHSALHHGERDTIPLWHLLGLLLSSQEEFTTASNACEAAFEILSTDTQLYNQSNDKSRRSSPGPKEELYKTLQSLEARQGTGSPEIEGRERESIVELQMTQLTLVDILHGPETALNHSDELIGLFGRLYAGIIGQLETKRQPASSLIPPRSSAGTVRSFRGSIFGWKRSQRYQDQEPEVQPNGAPLTGRESAATAPSIQVTNEDPQGSTERSSALTPHGSLRRKDGRPAQKLHRREGSLAKSFRRRSLEKPLNSTPTANQDARDRDQYQKENRDRNSSEISGVITPTAGHDGVISAAQDLPCVAHNMNYKKEPAPAGHSEQPPRQDVRLPTSRAFDRPPKAPTRFPRAQAQKSALALLVKIWLFIASLYRRASLFEDALEACNEASVQATRIETLVAAQESSARAFAEERWGGAKSSDEVWADVFAEKGYLALSASTPHQAMKYFEEALVYFPDHPRATVGLANILLDIYEQKIPVDEPASLTEKDLSDLSLKFPAEPNLHSVTSTTLTTTEARPDPAAQKDAPETLQRLAARDRAYGLLSALTKLGTAWDDSEAWFALSRAHEQGGQIEKAKEVLWWCIDLEDTRPARHWWSVGSGGYVL